MEINLEKYAAIINNRELMNFDQRVGFILACECPLDPINAGLFTPANIIRTRDAIFTALATYNSAALAIFCQERQGPDMLRIGSIEIPEMTIADSQAQNWINYALKQTPSHGVTKISGTLTFYGPETETPLFT